jgi:hypothetical protein
VILQTNFIFFLSMFVNHIFHSRNNAKSWLTQDDTLGWSVRRSQPVSVWSHDLLSLYINLPYIWQYYQFSCYSFPFMYTPSKTTICNSIFHWIRLFTVCNRLTIARDAFQYPQVNILIENLSVPRCNINPASHATFAPI